MHLDHEDLHLGEEMQRELVDRVAQDRLLDEQHVAAALLHLLAHVEDVLALLLEDPVLQHRRRGEGRAGRPHAWARPRAICV